MGQFIDLTGRRFGMLKVLGNPKHNKNWKYEWLCRCECGNEKYIVGYNLRNGKSNSCGCERNKNASIAMKNYHKKRASKKEAKNKIPNLIIEKKGGFVNE